MKDGYRSLSPDADKIWLARHFTGMFLYEFANDDEFRADRETRQYNLSDPYYGTGHTVYDGAFIYHKMGTRELVRFDLGSETSVALEIPFATYHGESYLYSTKYNYFDFAVDENGLWVIYSAGNEHSSLIVSKLIPHSMQIENTWSVSVQHRNYGNGFITCGVLYLVKDTTTKNTVIDFAYNLYMNDQLSNVLLSFTNPFQMNNMVSYNPRDKNLYSFDKGNNLKYPLVIDDTHDNNQANVDDMHDNEQANVAELGTHYNVIVLCALMVTHIM